MNHFGRFGKELFMTWIPIPTRVSFRSSVIGSRIFTIDQFAPVN
jgi:hypothetical protein